MKTLIWTLIVALVVIPISVEPSFIGYSVKGFKGSSADYHIYHGKCANLGKEYCIDFPSGKSVNANWICYIYNQKGCGAIKFPRPVQRRCVDFEGWQHFNFPVKSIKCFDKHKKTFCP